MAEGGGFLQAGRLGDGLAADKKSKYFSNSNSNSNNNNNNNNNNKNNKNNNVINKKKIDFSDWSRLAMALICDGIREVETIVFGCN